MRNRTTTLAVLVTICIGCTLIAVGCCGLAGLPTGNQTGSVSDPNPLMWRFSRGLMSSTDLPVGWSHRRDIIQDEGGGVGRLIIYYGDDNRQPMVSVNQLIVIYKDDQAAAAAYQTKLPIYIPPAYAKQYGHPAGLRAPKHAEESALYCHPLEISNQPAQACVVVARYGDMFSAITATVYDNRWMTMPELAHLVDRVDEHMQSARRP